MESPRAVDEFAGRLQVLGWVTDLLVGGSLATGDYHPGVSDLDLVAIVDGPITPWRRSVLRLLHEQLETGAAFGAQLGCTYVEHRHLLEPRARHPVWTHGRLIERSLSAIARAELAHHGYAVFGHAPQDLLPVPTSDEVRDAARAELAGYWTEAVRRPWWWLVPGFPDLALTSMARARYAMATGRLITKTEAIELARAPEWLRTELRARRDGLLVRSPRLRTANIAWRDARRTVAVARMWHSRSAPDGPRP